MTIEAKPLGAAAAADPVSATGPQFGAEFRAEFETLLAWRRDVRRFRREPLPEGLLEQLLCLAELAPSVGLRQPWRFLRVARPQARARVRAHFQAAHQSALADYTGCPPAPH